MYIMCVYSVHFSVFPSHDFSSIDAIDVRFKREVGREIETVYHLSVFPLYVLDLREKERERQTISFLSYIGVRVLIDSKAQLTLLGTQMDFVEDKLASEFIFHNPNVKGTCGCGESFHV